MKIIWIAGIFSLLLFTTCKVKETEKKIEGAWIVEKVIINGEKIQPFINTAAFNDDGHCEVPVMHPDIGNTNGEWKVIQNDGLRLVIYNTDDELFNDTFNITFSTRKERIIKQLVEFESDSLYWKASKLPY